MQEQFITSIVLAVLGLTAGSFAGASVWRLRARQLRLDAKAGEKVTRANKRQIEKLQHKPVHQDRSVCLHCGHELQWYDLIPLVSWTLLAGKCRYCHKHIGWFEPIMELSVAAFFVISYLLWPMDLGSSLGLSRFIIWLVAGVGLAILFAYDAKWYLLPNVIVFPLIGLGVVDALVIAAQAHFEFSTLIAILMSAAVLGGLYYLIYIFSQHRWVGFGDVKLGLALGFLLGDWQLALLALFLANLIGTFLFLPALVMGRVHRQTHISFGPMLISGWLIAGLVGPNILSWYLSLSLGLR
jgi:prepilin signal peptidase PulO-like enzyme (type II secretory pathway)